MFKLHQSSNFNNISFKQANVNIMAFSDTHGNLKTIPALYQNFYDNKNDIFEKKEDKSTLNVMAIVGDWFMNPTQSGYQTKKGYTSGDYQELFLKTFIKNVKNYIPGLKTIYTPGNHCLDGGDKVLVKHIKNVDMETIISNADLTNSSLIKALAPKQKQRIQECKVLEVQDDKNPDLKHKVLVVGILPININYLVKEDIKGLNIIGAKNLKEADLSEKDSEEVSKILDSIIDKFKQENPDSPVILMNHSGESVAKSVAKKVGCIDLVLNAHDHLDRVSYVNNNTGMITRILSLSQNSEKLESVNLHFDDEGRLSIKARPYYTDFSAVSNRNPMKKMFENVFKKDLTPLLRINDPKNRESLSIDGVRYSNSDLANLCTDAIFSRLKKIYPDLNAFFLASTTFREDLPTSKTRDVLNLDVVDLLKGISGSLATVMVGEIKGADLVSYVHSNVLENLSSPSRNAINQYSGIFIDKTGIKNLHYSLKDDCKASLDEVSRFIKIKNNDGGYEPIDFNKNYTVALPKKIFVKAQEESIKKYQNSFVDTDRKVSEYFDDFLAASSKEIDLNLDERII